MPILVSVGMLWTACGSLFADAESSAQKENSWQRAPSLSKTAWRVDEEAATVDKGLPLYGTVSVAYSNRLDATVSLATEMPTEEGSYAAWFTVPATAEWTALETVVDFVISAVPEIVSPPNYHSIYDYAGRVTFTTSGFCGETGLCNFPVLIRLSNGNPSGFAYSQLRMGKEGIRFFDSEGQSLDYDIAVWDEKGESLIWVKVPNLNAGALVTMCWDLRDGCTLPAREGNGATWSGYAGVWHMDETITAETAENTHSADATENGHDLVPRIGPEGVYTTMTSVSGKFGNARVNDTSARYKKQGSYLEMADSANLAFKGVFTLSFWIKFDAYANYPHLASRRSASSGQKGFQIDLNSSNRRQIVARGDTQTGTYQQMVNSEFKNLGFTHLAFVYNGTNVSMYADGVCKKANMLIGAASDNGLPIVIGNQNGGTEQSVWGKYDEIRLFAGAKDAAWVANEHAVGTNTAYCVAGEVTFNKGAVLKNDWAQTPSLVKRTWDQGTAPTLDDFNLGTSSHGTPTILFYNRATGELIGDEPPKAVGEYRAVITVDPSTDAAGTNWGALTETIDFRIVRHRGVRDFGINIDRILLMNDDYSVSGGEVAWQCYDDEAPGSLNAPYWQHLDEVGNDASSTDDDYWSVSLEHNLGGGTHHIYWYRGVSLWDLDGVRIGNTFANGEDLEERTGEIEEGTQGLVSNQNYLCWSPDSMRVLGADGLPVDEYHRYAAQIVMQNVKGAAVTSSCFTNGIGTIYFDAVNGWIDNVVDEDGDANYQLVVEVATNCVGSTEAPTDDRIASTYKEKLYNDRGVVTAIVTRVYHAFEYADWQRVPMRVLRMEGETCHDLGMQETLDLGITSGKSYRDFYRVIVPLNCYTPGRFRIRRTRIDEAQSLVADGTAYILMDNIICSKPTAVAQLSPYGRYVSEKTGKLKLGWEGAFINPLPSSTEAGVRGRARATLKDGTPVPSGMVTAATMHYRWHYLEQKETGWKFVDLDPQTFVALRPLELPKYPGDIEFWFEQNQCGSFYEYADYSGTGLGLADSGYTEEIACATNTAASFRLVDGERRGDWFVRLREGSSDYAEMKVLIKTSADAAPTALDLYVVDDQLWRGYYRMPEVLPEGIWWRVEPRDRQDAGATRWMSNTNYWYVLDWRSTVPSFPATGRLSEGDTNAWCRMACDKQTGYLTFQVDESSLGVTVIHSDYQNFNNWNDAAKGYFTGSSTETNAMRGTSSKVQTFVQAYSDWANESATDSRWPMIFDGKLGQEPYTPTYWKFAAGKESGTQWDLGKGQWVHEYYRDEESRPAFQMAGCGEGYVEFASKTQLGNDAWPRGFEGVSFKARVAQSVLPERAACYDEGARLTNYTFMARTCFDMKQNCGFSGNASLSLFAYYRSTYGMYEARWEQIEGYIEETSPYEGRAKGPKEAGQRLVLLRWRPQGESFVSEELIATTNSVLSTWKFNMPKMPYTSGSTATNNLMPFLISAYRTEKNGPTYITAAVRVNKSANPSGLPAKRLTDDQNVGTQYDSQYWYFVTYCDTATDRLSSGTYGVLSSNCEGMFVNPVFRKQSTWPSCFTTPNQVTTRNNYPVLKPMAAEAAPGFVSCFDDICDGWWAINPGREKAFGNSLDANLNFGLMFVLPQQTVDVYTKSFKGIEPTGDWQLLDKITLTGFGSPGVTPDCRKTFYYASDSALRLQTGGDLNDACTDVVISDVIPVQWRGCDKWSTADNDWNWKTDSSKSSNGFGYTNIVFTTGWMTNGAVRLSARRTEVGRACSVRSPLFDGYDDRSVGLGMIGFTYREPQKNVRLKVQFVTNYTYNSGVSLVKMSRSVQEGDGDRDSWYTVTNLTYDTLMANYDAKEKRGEWSTYLGFHGQKGMMRIVVDDDLVKSVATETDVTNFGEIDITQVWCKDEPALDKGCWWGWNMRTFGDLSDTHKRMFLPDGTSNPPGQSLALNNSVKDGINPSENPTEFLKHMPFLQSPTFTNAIVGQISFKARKFDLSDDAPNAEITIYATRNNPDEIEDEDWELVDTFVISNSIYTSYECRTEPGRDFRAFRMAVTGVDDVYFPGPKPASGTPVRVLIDEVAISEAVRAVLAFRNVGAFRNNLDKNVYVKGVPCREEQPLCDENWAIQAELFTTMLGDEIDKSYVPRVKLHWYVGTDVWGYENWKKRETGSAYLVQTTSSNMVYRASYSDAPDAIMPAQSVPNTVVQYMLEVEYRTINTVKGETTYPLATNWLDAASWSAPDWFAPIDYNTDPAYGANKTFAGFTILDKVAPGWAWLNEANVLGTKDMWGVNSDEAFQYVEVCAPAEADLTGWRLRFLETGIYDGSVTTNWIAQFGNSAWDQLPGTKRGGMGMAEHKVFHLLGNKESDKLKKTDGTLDGIWQFATYTDTFRHRDSDDIDYIHDFEVPFGVQLVRPSGVIESSIVIIGTNRWGRLPGYREMDPSNIVATLNERVPGSKFFYAAEDCCGEGRSASVTDSRGESASVWTNDWACSPGYINTNFTGAVQKIDPDHPTPHGDTIIVYASVDTTFGHVHQEVGGRGSTLTNTTEMIILQRGSGRGTNIVYTVDPWYELKSVTTNEASEWAYVPRCRSYTATIGKGASNNITVVARAQVDSTLRDYGLTEDNPYTPAVMDWLINGVDAYGNPFAHPGEIALADYMDMAGAIVTNLTLTEMYWLDMDPTVSNLIFKAGMMKTWPVIAGVDPTGAPVEGYDGQNVLTNTRMRVYMMISNAVSGVNWSPYILRGLDPKLTSWEFAKDVYANTWTSETFKVTGILANGLTREKNAENWIPLRWFVFTPDSFYQRDEASALHEAYTTDIEIVDPRSQASPGAAAGWYDWCQEHGYTPVFNRWAIDTRLKPVGVEVLKKENYLTPAQ